MFYRKDGKMREIVVSDLEISPYYYDFRNMRFMFTTAYRRDKFARLLDERIDEAANRLLIRFRVTVDIPEIAAIRLYRDVEPIAFLIYVDGKAVEKWQDLIISSAKVCARF